MPRMKPTEEIRIIILKEFTSLTSLALQFAVNLGPFHDCSPLVPILCHSSPISKAHSL